MRSVERSPSAAAADPADPAQPPGTHPAERSAAADIAAAANRSILAAIATTRRRRGPDAVALEDGDGTRLTFDRLLLGACALARVLARRVPGDTVAIMLPSSAAGAIAFLAVLAAGKRPAPLNFTAGSATLRAACAIARVGAVVTADRFLEAAKLGPLADALAADVPLLKLEALRGEVTRRDKALAFAAVRLGLFPRAAPDDPAAIVFTSGSEGEPKAVALSHRNILANVEQVRRALPLDLVDGFFNPLPIFHTFGLVPGMILPLVMGLRLILHPSPLRAKEIAQRIAQTKPNVLIATDTFLRQYVRAGAEGSLSSLLLTVCGAERVRAETRALVAARYGFRVVEGYGVTEAAPVIAVNHPADIRDGTVGRVLPGIETRLDPVEGLAEGGRLFVRGPNVMVGYLGRDGSLTPPPDGWHDTGDVAAFDDGCLKIVGRLKRFAKIAGEMTSLATVEALAGAVWPDHLHAAAAVSGASGERIVLLTETPAPDPALLAAEAARRGLPNRYVPHRMFTVAAIPLTGTGKLDAVAATRLAAERLAADTPNA